jgi:hypothetical protein
MLPPTLITLSELAATETIEAALAASASRTLSVAVTPRIHFDRDGAWLLLS